MSTLTDSSQKQEIAISKLWWVGLVAAAGSAVANLILFGLAGGLFGAALMIPPEPGSTELAPLTAGLVIMASAIPAIGATVLFGLLGKFLKRGALIFLIVSGLFLLVSFAPVVSLPASVTLATKIWLGSMHVVSGLVIVGTLLTLGRS